MKALQQELEVTVDGIYGMNSYLATKILKPGSRGALVKILQCFLICHKQKIKADGIYGSQTETAVRVIQMRYKLKNDGIAGKMTFKALCS